jgi:hypothetical protein
VWEPRSVLAVNARLARGVSVSILIQGILQPR